MEGIKENLKIERRSADIMPKPEEAMGVIMSVKKVEADDDWDGIAAALIADRVHSMYAGEPLAVHISDAKVVPSDKQTLVVDKTTDGDGYVVDHHKGSVVPKSYLAFSDDGTIPSSSLMYRILPEGAKTLSTAFLAATGEIMDGLYERGERDGAVREVLEKMPALRAESTQKNQFGKKEELYSIADVIALLPLHSPEKAFEVGRKMIASGVERIKTVEDVLRHCDEGQREYVQRYLKFMNAFPYEKFGPANVGGFDVKIADSKELEFPMPALARILREQPGNYILFTGKGISIRTQDGALFEAVKAKMGDNFSGGGGRAGWYGMQLKQPMTYEQFKAAVGERKPVKVA